MPFTVLVGLIVVLTVVTLVGHGIWVLLAAVFGAGRARQIRRCVFCKQEVSASATHCV
jgi:hypothetical protein